MTSQVRILAPNPFARIFIVIISITCAFLTSCKDDEEASLPSIQFETSLQSINESSGNLESFHPTLINGATGQIIPIKLKLDKPLSTDITIKISVEGTATRQSNPNDLADFSFQNGKGIGISGTNVTILKGATEAIIKVVVFEDYDMEYDENYIDSEGYPYETIVIQLESISWGNAKIDPADRVVHTLHIREDDTLVYLEWDNKADPVGTNNMDIFVYIDNNLAGIANNVNTNSNFESIAIPGGFPEATFGLGYVYRKGTEKPLDYFVHFYNSGGTLAEAGRDGFKNLNFESTYGESNINNYSNSNPVSQIEQTMTKQGLNYIDVSDISVPETGSRNAIKNFPSKRISKKHTENITAVRWFEN